MRLSFSERRTGHRENPIFALLFAGLSQCVETQQPTTQHTKVLVHSTQLPNSFSQNDEHLWNCIIKKIQQQNLWLCVSICVLKPDLAQQYQASAKVSIFIATFPRKYIYIYFSVAHIFPIYMCVYKTIY